MQIKPPDLNLKHVSTKSYSEMTGHPVHSTAAGDSEFTILYDF